MDSLAQILTDPLCPKEDNDGQITEECMLGNCRVRLPEDLLEDPEIFFSVTSESTWTEVLSDSQRVHLRQFLPQFPENNAAAQDRTIRDLFNNKNFSFGNPLNLAQKMFRDGYFNPEVVKYRQLCAKSQRKRRLYSLQQYYHRLLKQILVSRKDLLELAVHSGLDFAQKRALSTKAHVEMQEPRVRRRVSQILQEVRTECGDGNVSSDDEGAGAESSWPPAQQTPSSPTSILSLRVLPSLSTQDMKTTAKAELGERDLRTMLQNHREKRRRQPDHPDLMTSDIHLGGMLSRVNVGRRSSSMALLDLALPKKKIKEERRKKKLRTVKLESEDPCDSLMATDAPALSANHIPSLPNTPTPPLANVKEEAMDECQSSPAAVEEISVSFFNLLDTILKAEHPASTTAIEERVQLWQSSPASSLNSWFSLASCWSELVLPALQFLAGEAKDGMMTLPSGFAPYVEFGEQSQQWRWTGPSQDAEKDLSALCQLWIDSKDLVVKMEHDDLLDLTSPTPRVSWTDYVVRPSTGDERHVFQIQEQQRYDQPHKAFTFRMHGFESVVGPVKGVFDKEMSLNKAREHTLLRSDRPAYVTILSLVRDAAARLPNGEGTRAEICELLKDSQFLAPDITSAQVNTVVSGALDRLHYEKDPCVKYDIGRKLWIYLHRDRSQEEFEMIHQAQAAAAKARKALQQKPKPPSKPKSGGKEGGGKIPGSLEAGAEVGVTPMSPTSTTPTPSTPGTPKSPLASTVGTPTKSGLPDAMKSSPGVLLVSPPSMPQLGTILPGGQTAPPAPQPASSQQHAARIVSHLAAGALPQVRVSAGGPHATLLHHTPHHQIRVPVSMGTKGLSQNVVSLPLRSQAGSSPVQVPTTLSVSALPLRSQAGSSPVQVPTTLSVSALPLRSQAGGSPVQVPTTLSVSALPLRSQAGSSPVQVPTTLSVSALPLRTQAGSSPVQVPTTLSVSALPLRTQAGSSPVQVPTTLSVSALAVSKLPPGSPGSPAKPPALLQGVTGQNIKQVSITGQLGVKTAGGAAIPMTATNLRIQGKDILRLPSSSITTDAKGQTVLRITPDMMATLAKSPVATVKLSPDFLGSGSPGGGKSISATLHVAPPHSSASSLSGANLGDVHTGKAALKAGPASSTLLKAAGDTAIRLMPTLAVTVSDQKTRTFSTVSSPDSKSGGATIRIMPGLGVIPQKQGQTITMTTATGSKPLTVTAGPGAVAMGTGGAKGITVGVTASGSPLTLGTATATVVTTQAGKLPARITVPLSVLNQPLKSKSVVTTPMVKGSINANLSSLGRNIILTTMPAGAKLIAGNKPVSFVTAQQLQRLQQQGQATQVRIQTVQTQQLQQHMVAGSPKSLSTVVVTTAPSPNCPPDPPPAPQP